MKNPLLLRVLCFLACIPSGGALLAKVFGLASLQFVTLAIFIPCALFLIVVWWRKEPFLATALVIGFWGGLLGTFAYDVARIPFVLLGQRIFAPISVYGVWLAEADHSSQWTEVLGWAYHFSNGITFGIMYAVWMARRHWAWAIPWAFLLETIAVLSPFGRIFNVAYNPSALAIAYWGHLAYALPLGWLVYRWAETERWLNARPVLFRRFLWPTIALLTVGGMLLAPAGVARDSRFISGALRVEGYRLNPNFIRLEAGESLTLANPDSTPATIIIKSNNTRLDVPAGGQAIQTFPQTGIYQLFVQTSGQTRSSFVIVEPVEKLPPKP